jgi:hypothetical protein
MVVSRLVLAILAVFVVRTGMNASFYGYLMADHFRALQQVHPGLFREVIPGLVGTDLVWAAIFCFLFVKVGRSLGTGIGAGVTLGIFVALLGQALGNLYYFFTTTYMTPTDVVVDGIYALIAYAIQGAVAPLVYKQT